jgi:hypothetical protein
MASAKLAKSTVNQSQRETWRTKPAGSFFDLKKRPRVVNKAPTSVTKMTGFFNRDRGFNFLRESTAARPKMARSKRERLKSGTVCSPSI